MLAGLETGLLLAACLGCGGIQAERLPPPDVVTTHGFASAPAAQPNPGFRYIGVGGADLRLPLPLNPDFSLLSQSQLDAATRFKALDLSAPVRFSGFRSEVLSAELSFGLSSANTDFALGGPSALDAAVPHRSGKTIFAGFSGEVRVGQGFLDRDLRGKRTDPPAWYFFVGADNKALVWNVADRRSVRGLALRDQVTTGGFQAGLALSTFLGGETSVGFFDRKYAPYDAPRGLDVPTHETFAALSFAFKH